MKCISLWQPWASAVALRLKLIETRGWRTAYAGRIAIHAAKHWTKAEQQIVRERRAAGDPLPDDLPLGAVVATTNIVFCVPTDQLVEPLSSRERAYGDYSAGRWAWYLNDTVALREPIPFKGAQGFFEVPDDLFTDEERIGHPGVASPLNPVSVWPFPSSSRPLSPRA
jgi:hypothetical protein